MTRLEIKLTKTYNPASQQEVMKKTKRDFNEIVLDLRAVSQSLTPKLSGKLERSATSKVVVKNDAITGYVEYRAKSTKGYNYAKRMHDATYNLGKESRKKRALKSKFARGTLTVGTGYLSKPAEMSREGYIKYLEKKTTEALNTSKLVRRM